MPETEPLYFMEFRKEVYSIFKTLDQKIDDLAIICAKSFTGIEGRLDNIDSKIINIEGSLVDIDNRIDEMATKEDSRKIMMLIGSYEVRAINNEDILLKDHKPRIIDLEKEVFTV